MAETQVQGTGAQAQPVAQPEPVAPVAEPVAPVAPAPAPALPTETRDRTREQFEKLLESNRRLNDELLLRQKELENQRQLNQQFTQQRTVQQPNQVDPKDFIEKDPITGESYINESRLRARLEEVTNKANRLEQTLQSYAKSAEEREVERQERETYSAYPELNPNNATAFDQNFNRHVRSILTDSFYNSAEYGGRPFSFKEAADYVRAQFPKPTTTSAPTADDAAAKAKAEADAANAQAQKEQGSAQTPNQPRNAQAISDDQQLEDLRYRTRYLNDDWALAQRIVNTDHVSAKDAS